MLQEVGAREALVRSAMQCVVEGTWDSTSLRAVRERAGVSNGSLFHYFPSRLELTAAVVGQALQEHQRVMLAQLGAEPELAVAGAVRQHPSWVNDNRPAARLLLSAPAELLRLSLSGPVLDNNRHFFVEIASWLRQQGWQGRVPLPVVLALWVGPAQEYSRQCLGGDDEPALMEAADALGAGAWAALQPLLNDTPQKSGGRR